MELDPGMHIGLHFVFFGKPSVTVLQASMSSRRLECDWGWPSRTLVGVRDASPHAGGGGGGPAQHHTVGISGEPPGRRIPLLVARASWLLTVLDPIRHLAHHWRLGGARGPRWWWWRMWWWKQMRRGEWRFWGRSRGNRFMDLGWNTALCRVKYNWWHNRDELP
jgi:hypothetical protein